MKKFILEIWYWGWTDVSMVKSFRRSKFASLYPKCGSQSTLTPGPRVWPLSLLTCTGIGNSYDTQTYMQQNRHLYKITMFSKSHTLQKGLPPRSISICLFTPWYITTLLQSLIFLCTLGCGLHGSLLSLAHIFDVSQQGTWDTRTFAWFGCLVKFILSHRCLWKLVVGSELSYHL